MAKNTNKNTSRRSVHQSIKPLEDAVASFIADIEDRLEQQRRAEKARDGRGGWYTLKDVAIPLDKLKAAFLAHRGEAPEVPRAPYQRTVTRNNIRDVEMEETHESYGLAQISRVSGGARLFGSSVRHLDDSAPFILKVFGEHTEKMVAKGKLEVESFITLAFQRAGIKSIKDSGGKLLLGSGEGEDSED